MRAVVTRRRDMPEYGSGDENFVAGSDPTYGCRFDEADVYGYNSFTAEQHQWFNESFLCRMGPDTVVKFHG